MKAIDRFNSIAVEALSLTARERGDLVAKLIRSLDKDTVTATREEHLAIVYERMGQYESGKLSTRPADEVIKEMREKYGL